MAIKNASNIDRDSEVKSGLPPVGWQDCVSMRVKKASFGMSRSDLPMITLDTEIFRPQEVTGPDGNKYDLTGVNPTIYLPLHGKMLQIIIDEVLPKLGLPQEIDDEQPDLEQFNGLCFDIVVNTSERTPMQKDPENPGKYKPLTDSRGNEVKLGSQLNVNIKNIVGLCEAPDQVNPY